MIGGVIALGLLAMIVYFWRRRRLVPSFAGQHVLITGVSEKNIGEAFATIVSKTAARVTLLHCRATGMEEVMRRVGASSSAVVVAHEVDLSDEKATAQMVASLSSTPVNVAVFCHVICSHYAPATNIPLDVVDRHLRVNFLSVVHLTQLLLSLGGLKRLLVFSSAAALIPQPNRSAYCASKAALTSWMSCLAVENPGMSIQVCHPGMVDTPPVAVEYDDGVRRSFGALSPDAVARAALADEGFVVYIPLVTWFAHLLWVLIPAVMRRLLPRLLPRTKAPSFTK